MTRKKSLRTFARLWHIKTKGLFMSDKVQLLLDGGNRFGGASRCIAVGNRCFYAFGYGTVSGIKHIFAAFFWGVCHFVTDGGGGAAGGKQGAKHQSLTTIFSVLS